MGLTWGTGTKRKMADGDWISRRWQGEGSVTLQAEACSAKEKQAQKEKKERLTTLRAARDLEGISGRHCEHCREFDYLPSQCDTCKKYFCSQHAHYEAHGCQRPEGKGRVAPTCLLCEKPIHIRVEEGESVDHAMDRHIESGCKSGLAEQVRKQRNTMNRCCFGKGKKACKECFLTKFKCPDCDLEFCLKHRHPSDHKCKGAMVAVDYDSMTV